MNRGNDIAMRPDILNPLFAEVEALKGIGLQPTSRWRLKLSTRCRPALRSPGQLIDS